MKLLWVLANNRKLGLIPGAYVGTTKDQAWKSCEGCPLRGGKCYAWVGMNGAIFTGHHVKRYKSDPEHFSLENVLVRLPKEAKAARVGTLGDPARASRTELLDAIFTLRSRGLAVLGYTHFWRDAENQDLKTNLMASCDSLKEAAEAKKKGWRPAAILPWDWKKKTFELPDGSKGLTCPAQTKDAVTCNSCRLCDPKHKVWAAGKISAIGFVEHSPRGRAAQRREANEKTLPLFVERKIPLSGLRS